MIERIRRRLNNKRFPDVVMLVAWIALMVVLMAIIYIGGMIGSWLAR